MTGQYIITPNGTKSLIFSFQAKDKWSAITHFIGMLGAIFLLSPLLVHASLAGATRVALVSLSIFMISMILLYGASATYHAFYASETITRRLRKLDHSMIAVLIAGSYTPVCTCLLAPGTGTFLLILVWSLALMSIIFKLFWITCPKWISSVIYLVMGWSVILVMPQVYAAVPFSGFMLLLIGGIVYSIGGVLYALKLKALSAISPEFGAHEIFHVCVMIGSLFHYAFMWNCIR